MVATFSATSDKISVSSAGMSRRGRRAVPAVKSARNAVWQAPEAVRQGPRNPGTEGQEKAVKAAAKLADTSLPETSGSKAAAQAWAALNTATGLLKSVKTTEPAAGKSQAEKFRSRDGQIIGQTRNCTTAKGLSLTQDQIEHQTKADLGKVLSRFASAWVQANAKVRSAANRRQT